VIPHRQMRAWVRCGPGLEEPGLGWFPATAPTIANALYDALGIRFNDMPLTAERVFLAWEEKKQTV